MTHQSSPKTRLRLGHSPDPDDAFMFYPLTHGKIDTEGLEFDHLLRDIETLNRMALEGELEVTAASVHAYGHLAPRYAILESGGSYGEGYGPVLVSRTPLSLQDLAQRTIAVPGTLTSAFLALRIRMGEFEHRTIPFDQIPARVLEGELDAGLLIHEGQLTFERSGLHLVLDLGKWWRQETGLPLPLGVNLVRKDLGGERCAQVERLLRRGIDYSLSHRAEALDYALKYGRGIPRALADRFVGMYVNERTRAAGPSGRRAIALFLARAHEIGLLPQKVVPEFVES